MRDFSPQRMRRHERQFRAGKRVWLRRDGHGSEKRVRKVGQDE